MRRAAALKTAYLDNSATTQVCPQAAQKAMDIMTGCYGNPSSLHSMGVAAEQELKMARGRVAARIGCRPECLIFTSGGTEANNLAVMGGADAKLREGRHIITTAMEHPSVSICCDKLEHQGYTVTRLRPKENGIVSSQQVIDACRPDTVLVSIMMVNNETGAWFPIEQIVQAVRRTAPQALIHCDAVQAAGKLSLRAERLDVDMMSISSHKIHGPKGCGALYVKKGVRITPRVFGGNQERGIRSGTEAMPLLAAFGVAAEASPPSESQNRLYTALRQQLVDGIADRDDIVINSPEQAVPYIVNLSVPGIRSETLLHFLAERDIFVSSGSACSKGHKSPVLAALSLPTAVIDSALRVSFSYTNTQEDVERFLAGLREATTVLIRKPYSLK
jgi:cysteine desulfurase